MKNIGYKKGFVFVILVVMLLIVPSALATFTPNVVETLNNNIKSVDKPDLVIQDVMFDWDEHEIWYGWVILLNQGPGDFQGDEPLNIRIVVLRPRSNLKVLDRMYHFGGQPMWPDEKVWCFLPTGEPPGYGTRKVYFMIDPDDEIDESNEINNVLWAYFDYSFYITFPNRISDWYQVSKIPESMPRNKATDNMLLLRLLERFTLIQRLLKL